MNPNANPDANPTPVYAGSLTASANKLGKLQRRYFCSVCFAAILIGIVIGASFYSVDHCHREPAVELEGATVRDIAVSPFVNATNVTSWEVATDINITLSFRNQNTLLDCVTTPRDVMVSTYYAGNTKLSVSHIHLTNFTLKPRRSRVVSAQLFPGRFPLRNDSAGPALAAILRTDNQSIILELIVDTRYKISTGTSHWTHSRCSVTATTPLRSTPVRGIFCIRETWRGMCWNWLYVSSVTGFSALQLFRTFNRPVLNNGTLRTEQWHAPCWTMARSFIEITLNFLSCIKLYVVKST